LILRIKVATSYGNYVVESFPLPLIRQSSTFLLIKWTRYSTLPAWESTALLGHDSSIISSRQSGKCKSSAAV